jgi:hypothetical protein
MPETTSLPISLKKIVVVFDICSSSNIIEDLTLTDNLEALQRLFRHLRIKLLAWSNRYKYIVYNFTGDGWVLLFPEEIKGEDLLSFLILLSELYESLYKRHLEPLLEKEPNVTGLTFGIERGSLVQLTMPGGTQYVGRALNIACRLQGAIKDRDNAPEYKALVSKQVFNIYFSSIPGVSADLTERTLHNIRGGESFSCARIDIRRSY